MTPRAHVYWTNPKRWLALGTAVALAATAATTGSAAPSGPPAAADVVVAEAAVAEAAVADVVVAEDAADGSIGLSMVELLAADAYGYPVSLGELRDDVLNDSMMYYGGDGSGIDIALIDSGVAPVDGLDGSNVMHGPDLSKEGGIKEVAYLDTYGHGTHMAGIMAGQRDGDLGVAEGARVVSLKVAGADGQTTVAQVVAAIDWVVEHRNRDGLNIRILNLSLGQAGVETHVGDPLSAAVERAWDAGIFVVVSAGNRGETQNHLDSPAIDPHVMAVAAIDSTPGGASRYHEPTDWTARGTDKREPELAAPGVSIASYRVPGSTIDELAPGARFGEDLFRGSGTSQSAAVISGLAARLLSDYPDMTPEDLKKTLNEASRTSLWVPETIIGEGAIHGGIAWKDPRFDTEAEDHDDAYGPGTGIELPKENTWSSGTWSSGTWSGASWSGATWSGGSWSGASWSGASWSGASWSGASWSGASWSGASWSGASWSGASWSGASWSGNGWS